MRFGLSDDQQEIKAIARDVLERRSPVARVRELAEQGRDDDALWAELVELGWPGVTVGERHGGLGLGIVEAMCLAEELGYALACTPFLSTVATAAILERAGSAAQRDAWLPRLASGEAVGAVAVARDGVAELVADAVAADVIVVVEGGRAELVEAPDADVRPIETIDLTRRYATVRGGGTPLDGDPAAGVACATVLVAAELVGICQRALDMTVAYVSERRQFDRPVGSFQAVAHRCADMLLETEGARSATYRAAWACDADPAGAAEAAALAKAAASEAGRQVTASAIQAHGGIGFSWEADLHLLLKRAQLGALLYGGPGEHRIRVCEAMARERAAPAGG